MKRAKVRYRVVTPINYENLGKPPEIFKWWSLKGKAGRFRDSTGKRVRIFGYCAFPEYNAGPWYGVRVENVSKTPCNACGKTGIFSAENVSHVKCRGTAPLPDGTDYKWTGHPSCSSHRYCENFAADEWEIDLETSAQSA